MRASSLPWISLDEKYNERNLGDNGLSPFNDDMCYLTYICKNSDVHIWFISRFLSNNMRSTTTVWVYITQKKVSAYIL